MLRCPHLLTGRQAPPDEGGPTKKEDKEQNPTEETCDCPDEPPESLKRCQHCMEVINYYDFNVRCFLVNCPRTGFQVHLECLGQT